MPSINIKGQNFAFSGDEIINFAEGLVGLPEMRRAVLIPLADYEPFFWLASLDDERTRFVVVNPHEIFDGYKPEDYAAVTQNRTKTFVIVKISSDWQKTTVNLRAPLFIDQQTKRGVQTVLSESPYGLAETLPQN